MHDQYADLIEQLDLRAKITLLTGATAFTLAPNETIGLGEIRLSDGPAGVRGLKFAGGRTVALLPNATLLAAAWSEQTAYEVGRLLAEEAMAQQIHVVLGPTINLHRSLLGGRLFEAYSEDPLLTGKLAAAYVRGLQDSGVGACLKHLVANESETNRNTMNSVVDEATLRELYLLPFEIAAAESGAWSMMAAYNDVNGVAATPPTQTSTVDVVDGALIEATVSLRTPGQDDAQPLAGVGQYGLIARAAPRDGRAVIADAVAAASAADLAVVVVGLTEEQETEAVDKSTLRLPGDQDALVSAVAAAAKRTVVVVNAATPVLMPWLDQVDAVLWAGLPGQEGGHAVAAALLGDIEPAGRLVTTFPADDGQAPAWSVTPVDGAVTYTEGPYIGYRGHFAGRAPAPRFWLGHGLGYATWEYGDVRVGADADAPVVTVSVTNTGTRPSREVVQVYFQPAEDDQPVRLAGWQAANAAPGETVTVEVPLDARLWRRWDTAAAGWARLTGAGRLLVARGLGDIRASVDLDDNR